MKCKLVGYRRVSTKKQGESGLGLEAQDSAIADHVKATGCTLIASYTEVESGKRSDRPELLKAMAHARRTGATLVVAKIDRLSRNVAFLSALMESRVKFIACDNPNASDLTVHILASVAQDEAKKTSERTKAALAAYKARGGKLGAALVGSPLTAESRAKGTARSSERQAREAVSIYADLMPMIRQYRTAGFTLQAIADLLNTDGHTTRTGKTWGQVQVKRVLDRASV
jgi:DNA invertase Pin-like site-specific DNA recombinase